MSALGKIFGTVSRVSNPYTLASGLIGAASGQKYGSDLTPGYSATNVARTQFGNLTNSSSADPFSNPKQQSGTAQASSGPYTDPGAGGGSATPQDALAQALRTQVAQKISAIQQAYDALNAGVDTSVQDKANSLRQNYGQQTTQLGDTYKDTANQLSGNYQNRGLGDSSYAGNAQDSATKTYQNNLNAINQSQNDDLAQLGQYAQSAHAQYNAAKNGYGDYLQNLPNYGGADLQTLLGNITGAQQQVATQQAGMGTQGQFINQLNAIAPKQNGGAGELQGQLQSVLSSAAPGFAKQTIAQGLINQSTNGDPAQQSYWNQYFNQFQSTANTGK